MNQQIFEQQAIEERQKYVTAFNDTMINPSLIPDNYFQQFLGVFVELTVCLSATASWKIEL